MAPALLRNWKHAEVCHFGRFAVLTKISCYTIVMWQLQCKSPCRQQSVWYGVQCPYGHYVIFIPVVTSTITPSSLVYMYKNILPPCHDRIQDHYNQHPRKLLYSTWTRNIMQHVGIHIHVHVLYMYCTCTVCVCVYVWHFFILCSLSPCTCTWYGLIVPG